MFLLSGVSSERGLGISPDNDTLCLELKSRRYTQWSLSDTKLVRQYFSDIVRNGKPLPGKQVVLDFQKKYNVTHDWKIIKTKVFNEKMTYLKHKTLNMDSLMAKTGSS